MTMSINSINSDYRKNINPIKELSQVRQETQSIRQQLNRIDREINLHQSIANNLEIQIGLRKDIIINHEKIIQNNNKMIELYKETNRKLLALKSNSTNKSPAISNKNLIKSEELTKPKVMLSDKSKHTEQQVAKLDNKVTANDNYFKKKSIPEYVSIYEPTKEQTIQIIKTQDSVIENDKSENNKNIVENTFNYNYRSNIYTDLISRNLSKLL